MVTRLTEQICTIDCYLSTEFSMCISVADPGEFVWNPPFLLQFNKSILLLQRLSSALRCSGAAITGILVPS